MFHASLTKADGTQEQVEVWEPEEYELPILEFEKRGRGRRGNTADYYDAIINFDTETSKLTHYEDVCGEKIEMVDGVWLYQWAVDFAGDLIAGRTVDSLVAFMKRVHTHYKLDSKAHMVWFCHNLPYDASYIVNALWKVFDHDIKMFATGQRRPIRITCGKGLELRCSYKLVNKSLADWCEDVEPAHKKLVGEIDYGIIRTPSSALSVSDWDYMLNDVVCQNECLQDLLAKEKLRTVPMTSTGFVRRAMREASTKDSRWRERFRNTLPTARQYQLLNKAFTGGYTHCNSFAMGIWENVQSFDAASMYPAVLATEPMPNGKWVWRRIHKLDELVRQCNDPHVATVVDIIFDHIRLRDMFTWNPYISSSRCDITKKHCLLDNGKVISANRIRIALTDIDFRIVMEQYDFDWCAILQVMECPRKMMPKWFLDAMRQWYIEKTQLKGVETVADKRRYLEAKQRLNAIYCTECAQLLMQETDTNTILRNKIGKYQSVKRIWMALKRLLKK